MERRYSSYSFSTSALDGVEWSASRHGRALVPGKGPPVPIVQEAGWAAEPVWTRRLKEKSFRLCRGSKILRLALNIFSKQSRRAEEACSFSLEFGRVVKKTACHRTSDLCLGGLLWTRKLTVGFFKRRAVSWLAEFLKKYFGSWS
jgi:hypothetical protein